MGTHISVRFAVLFLLVSEIAQFCLCGNTNIGCIEAERQALLKFKASFDNPSQGLLSTWKGNDCCQWEGIACSNVTGHVVSLNLSNPSFAPHDEIDQYYLYFEETSFEECYRSFILKAQNLDPSILQSKHLTHLDLSYNDFNGSPIPMFLGSMAQLTNLCLSNAGFTWIIPQSLGNLTKLRRLDLSFNNFFADEISWISQLSSLQHIDMSSVDLGKTHNFFQVLNLLPSLLQIYLVYRQLASSSFPHHPLINLTNLTKIEVLDLSDNALQTPFLDAFQNMTSVSVLFLYRNNLDSLPLWFGNFNNLAKIYFWQNRFDGQFPLVLQNLTSIRVLDFSSNNLSLVPSWFVNLRNLVYLDLSNCLFHGPIPDVLQSMTYLTFLDLSENNFTSVVPSWMSELKRLVYLYLEGNALKNKDGSLSLIFRNICSLELLNLSRNNFQGEAFGAYEFDGCNKYNLELLDFE